MKQWWKEYLYELLPKNPTPELAAWLTKGVLLTVAIFSAAIAFGKLIIAIREVIH